MEPITPAERRLLADATAAGQCNLLTPAEQAEPAWGPSAEVAAIWSEDRQVRADFLRHLLIDQQLPVHLTGARIDGNLYLTGGHTLTLSLPRCILTGAAHFDGTTFAGDARFDGATFTGDARFGFARATRFVRTTFTGDAQFDGVTFAGDARFDKAIFTRDARFVEATFTGDAQFDRATFTGDAQFDRATFTGDARFVRATFTGYARFLRVTFTGAAQFDTATFTRSARFHRATFAAVAHFDGATFTSGAHFDRATFTRSALFIGATFAGNTTFAEATFTRDARFVRATFIGDTAFLEATFTRDAHFDEATFTAGTYFDGATFTGAAWFRNSRWRTLGWSRTVWKTASVESAGLAAVEIVLDRAEFEQPVRLELAAGRVSMERMQATERLHLVIAGAQVNLEDADFAVGSLIDAAPVQTPTTATETTAKEAQEQRVQKSGIGRWVFIPPYPDPDYTSATTSGLPPDEDTHQVLDPAQRLSRSLMYASLFLEADLSTALDHTPTASVTSLRRTHVAGTSLSGMDLRACTFTGADGLDKLVIVGDDILTNHRGDKDMMRAGPARGRKWWRTSRRVLHDELAVRQPHPAASDTAGASGATDATVEPAATPTAPLTYRSVSATYRSLRKALEDSRDEPGAADFYYGEMTMRRLAASPLSVERSLLTLYWLIAGYGLRAWRALATLVVVIAVAGWCFTNDAWAVKTVTKTPTSVDLGTGAITSSASTADGLSLMRSWLFAAQEAVVPFRPAGLSGVTLTSWGHVVDLAVRILGPILLALAVLAIRNRTKR
ncbi:MULTISPECIES: pentapeptide repeat-containing protein [Gordonia]|uniref:pentapeptide repeat-containing protein n=1 Tax=Gordonia TaxID=2053 RepID=UPI00027DE6D8|nr:MULTISPECIES: pentapeptide repeat-containing protein [Gordonia]AFR51582.1 hypothetical protein KTR9_5369 [Gordonia sp. KTR9]